MAVDFTQNLGEAMEHLYKKGAFLTVKNGDSINTMTISWGSIGYVWGRPTFTVLVRESRYTHEFIEGANEFTVSIPLDDSLKKELAFCGTKSGRDFDKFKECSLSVKEGKSVATPVIDGCGIYYECKVVYKQDMNPELLADETKNMCYKAGDYHTVYYGEILNCYTK